MLGHNKRIARLLSCVFAFMVCLVSFSSQCFASESVDALSGWSLISIKTTSGTSKYPTTSGYYEQLVFGSSSDDVDVSDNGNDRTWSGTLYYNDSSSSTRRSFITSIGSSSSSYQIDAGYYRLIGSISLYIDGMTLSSSSSTITSFNNASFSIGTITSISSGNSNVNFGDVILSGNCSDLDLDTWLHGTYSNGYYCILDYDFDIVFQADDDFQGFFFNLYNLYAKTYEYFSASVTINLVNGLTSLSQMEYEQLVSLNELYEEVDHISDNTDTIVDQNDEIIEQNNSIISTLVSLPDTLSDAFSTMLTNLFVPDDDYFSSKIEELQESFQDSFGIIGLPVTFTTSVVGAIIDTDPSDDVVLSFDGYYWGDQAIVPPFDIELSATINSNSMLDYLYNTVYMGLLWIVLIGFIIKFAVQLGITIYSGANGMAAIWASTLELQESMEDYYQFCNNITPEDRARARAYDEYEEIFSDPWGDEF